MDQLQSQHAEARMAAFGYVCHACSRCCHDKHIQTNPYEIARLARHFGMSTGEFSARWTPDGAGTALSQTPEGACVFLGEKGCTVHPARPLVCRLYPLGRRRAGDGNEYWSEVKPHPHSLGEYTGAGTIADYLAAQGAQPFIDAADGYVDWVNAAREVLMSAEASAAVASAGYDLLDMDEALAHYCSRNGLAAPNDIESRKDLHLRLLYEELAALKGNADDEA